MTIGGKANENDRRGGTDSDSDSHSSDSDTDSDTDSDSNTYCDTEAED